MQADHSVMGLFSDEDAAASAIEALKETRWAIRSVHSPIPSHKLSDTLKLKTSKVGFFTLTGGITGFFTGFLLAAFTASQWNLVVSGKPIIALVPFFIVGFEFTILFAVFGNIVGLIHQMQLPGFKGLEQYDPRCSGDRFGILASCEEEEQEALSAFFTNRGAEIGTF